VIPAVGFTLPSAGVNPAPIVSRLPAVGPFVPVVDELLKDCGELAASS
jgi:hypothetical protein